VNRFFGLIALGLILVIVASGLYWWSEMQLNQSEILIPVQPVASQAEHTEPSVSPEQALRQFSIVLESRGISISTPDPFDRLPYILLDQYMRVALTHPETFFSENFETSSALVAAAWLRKQRLLISPRQAWTNCLKLRWIMPRIHEIISTCQQISRWAVLLFSESRITYSSKILQIDRPPEKLVRLQRAYLRNPFHPSALEKLSLTLARTGDSRLARKLAEEMLQFDVDRASRLEQELIRIEGYSHPWWQFDIE